MVGLAGITATDVAVRFVFGGLAVALSAVVSRLAGGHIGGVFAAFPAVFLSATVTATMGLGDAASSTKVAEVSQGALIGMLANVVCAIAAGAYVRRLGVARGLARAVAVWLVVSLVIFFAAIRLGLLK